MGSFQPRFGRVLNLSMRNNYFLRKAPMPDAQKIGTVRPRAPSFVYYFVIAGDEMDVFTGALVAVLTTLPSGFETII
jgi:hypothetical protein